MITYLFVGTFFIESSSFYCEKMRLKVADGLLVILVNSCMNLNPYFREKKAAKKFLDKSEGRWRKKGF